MTTFSETATGGSETTYECDYFWINTGITAVPFVGGACNHDAGCGARSLYCSNAATSAYWSIGASLSLKNPS